MDKGNTKPIDKGKGVVKSPEVRFNLKSIKDKNKSTLIVAVFRYDGHKLVYSTQHKIAPKYWSLRTQKPLSNYVMYHEVNDDLKKISDAIITIHKSAKGKPISVQDFKNQLDVICERVNVEVNDLPVDLLGFLKSYFESLDKGNDKNKRTAQKYRTLFLNLQKFRPGRLPFEAIDLDFQKEFIQWRYEHTGANSQNTINKDIGTLKTILKLSYKKLHHNDIFKEDEFNVKTVKTSIFALNEGEVNQLYECDLSDNLRLERIRDWFLISCWSALRWSDFSSISPEHIVKDNNDYFLRKKTIKTGELVFIPIDSRLYDMLKKYNFRSIDISNQKFNEYLKEVFEVAGITDKIILNTNFKGENKEVTERKCDIVSSHDGRRTWATINYLKGYPIGLLMQVTGHTMESTFLSYVGASSLDKARKLNELFKKG